MAVREGNGGLKLLGKKLGRNWLPVLIVSMLAVVAVAELNTPYMPAILWLCAIIAILAVR
ncbi:phosphate regulon sensor histidine kinase PhoR, partial [Rhizobium sp. BR5]